MGLTFVQATVTAPCSSLKFVDRPCSPIWLFSARARPPPRRRSGGCAQAAATGALACSPGVLRSSRRRASGDRRTRASPTPARASRAWVPPPSTELGLPSTCRSPVHHVAPWPQPPCHVRRRPSSLSVAPSRASLGMCVVAHRCGIVTVR